MAAAVLALLAAVLVPAGTASAQFPQFADPPGAEGRTDGRELLTPTCVPKADRAATAEKGKIKVVMCDDNMTVESIATTSDIIFYPKFSPDRQNYVVYMPDDLTEVRFVAIFKNLFPASGLRESGLPGWAFAGVEGDTVIHPDCRECRWRGIGNNQPSSNGARVTMTPGVNTVKLVTYHWFQRWGPSPSESHDYAWVMASDKIAHKVYTLDLVWKSPDTPLEAPDEPAGPTRTVDYDTDDDGLIEVSSLAQLDAVRWDANGDGYADHGGPLHAGFPNALLGMGCPSSGCVGYELTADLDFDTNASGGADSGDDYWNSGHGWVPIGADAVHFSGVFEGNGHVISNLFINSTNDTQSRATGYAKPDASAAMGRVRSIHLGLFEELVNGGAIRNVVLESASVSRNFTCSHRKLHCADGAVGGLVGVSGGAISGSHVTGTVSNTITPYTLWWVRSEMAIAGGLVGLAHRGSVISSSSSEANVTVAHARLNPVGSRAGGLVGINMGAITAAGATGAVASNANPAPQQPGHDIGGLVGANAGTITASYATGAVTGGHQRGGLVGGAEPTSRVIDSYWDVSASGTPRSTGGAAKSTGELQAPTGYTGIYANWNVDLDGNGSADDPWDFGACNQYPRLKSAPARAGAGPTPEVATYSVGATASAVEGRAATLTLTLSEAAPAGGVQFTVTAGHGAGATASSSDVGTIASPVTVPEGETTVSVTVPTVQDALDESDETFTVAVTALTPCWGPSADGAGTATVTITDDDTPGVTVTAANPVSVDEGATATYSVVLDTEPSESVTITARSDDTDAVTVSPASHIFTATNWNAPATFTITAVADDDTDDESVAVSHRITRAGPEYAAVPLGTVAVTVTDTTPPPEQKEAGDPADQQKEAAAVPGPVTALELSATADSVTVSWQAPEGGIVPNRYIVHLRPEGGENGSGRTKTPKAKKTKVTFTNLEAGRTYTVWVRAQHGGTKGDRVTATITVTPTGDTPADDTATPTGDTATVTATGDTGDTDTDTDTPADDTATVTVANQAPTVASPLGDISGLEPGDTRQVSLSGVFNIPDNGSPAVTARSSATSVATLSVATDYSSLTVRAAGAGTATITVTASDGRDTVSDTFTVTVEAPSAEPEPQNPEDGDAETQQNDPVEAPVEDPVERYDANGDGKIDISEYQTALADYLGGSLTIQHLMNVRAAYANDAR